MVSWWRSEIDHPSDPYELAIASSKYGASPWTSVFRRFSKWREELDLPNPGNVEKVHQEPKETLASYIYDGGRAELTKSLSVNPIFQVSHNFSLGSSDSPSRYDFSAMYATQKLVLQGTVGHEGDTNARLNHQWSPAHLSKIQTQITSVPGRSMCQLEHEYHGKDFTLNFKAGNPWPTDLTGVYIVSYLQSVSKNLATGFESLCQHSSPGLFDFSTSYIARYTSSQRDWIATAQVQPAGLLMATYWHNLSPKLSVAADLQIMARPERREAIATLGAKYALRMATFKAQVDSAGKVMAVLEQRFLPTFAFTVSGEIDHYKNQARFGVGLMVESSSLTMEEMERQSMGMQP